MASHTWTPLFQLSKAKYRPSGDNCHAPLAARFGNASIVCPVTASHICTSLSLAVKIRLLWGEDCQALLKARFGNARMVCPVMASHIRTSPSLAIKIRLLSGEVRIWDAITGHTILAFPN